MPGFYFIQVKHLLLHNFVFHCNASKSVESSCSEMFFKYKKHKRSGNDSENKRPYLLS